MTDDILALQAVLASRKRDAAASDSVIVDDDEEDEPLVFQPPAEEEEEEPPVPVQQRKKQKHRRAPVKGSVNDTFRAEYGVLPLVKIRKLKDAVVQAQFSQVQDGVFEVVNAKLLNELHQIISYGIISAQNDGNRTQLTLDDAKAAFKQIGCYPTVFIG